MSSHLLNEIEDVLEDILLIQEGKNRLHMPVSDFKELAVTLRGKKDLLEELAKNKEVYYRERLGKDNSHIVVRNDYTESMLQQARVTGVEVLPVAADDLCVYLTAGNKGGIDDVFNRE